MGPRPAGSSCCCPQVFICGPSPHWLLVTSRGALRLHPMGIDGPIDSFAPFHNVNCPRGFLYFNRQVAAGGLGGAGNKTLVTRWSCRGRGRGGGGAGPRLRWDLGLCWEG